MSWRFHSFAGLVLLLVAGLTSPSSARPPGDPTPDPAADVVRRRPTGPPLLGRVFVADGSWEEVLPNFTHQDNAAIYDPVRQRMLVFEGGTGDPTGNDVWELTLDGSLVWRRLPTTGAAPPWIAYHTAVYDSGRDRMIVFGGLIGGATNDVWALSLAGTPTWEHLVVAGTPPVPRWEHSAIYDPRRDRMLVFGGWDGFAALNDVWELSLAGSPAWAELTPTGQPPSTRYDHTAIFDPVRDRMIVFAGYRGGGAWLNDLWALYLDGNPSWTQLTTLSAQPTPRQQHSAIYDPAGDRMVMFGGYPFTDSLNECWALTLSQTSWVPISATGEAPRMRHKHVAVYDPLHAQMVVSGGAWVRDFWALRLDSNPVWTRMGPGGEPAPGRWGHGAIYDLLHDRMVVFGGEGSSGEAWTVELAGDPRWVPLPAAGAAPAPLSYPTVIYDLVRDRMVVFEGLDTWTLTLGVNPTWIHLQPSGTSPGRYRQAAIYDPVRDRMIVFGGHLFDNGVWTLTLGTQPEWIQLLPDSTPPAARYGHTAIYDPVCDRMIIFGGHDCCSYYPLSDVWALSLGGRPYWGRLAPSGNPPTSRSGHTAIYDPVRDRMVVYGGAHLSDPVFSDVWALYLGGTPRWIRLSPTGGPPVRRTAHSAIYDPLRDGMVIHAGTPEIYTGRNDVWRLTWGSPVPTLVSLLSVEAEESRVVIAWFGAEAAALPADVERRTKTTEWHHLASVSADGAGSFRYEDRDVTKGAHYAYRLSYRSDGELVYTEETWVTVPSPTMRLSGLQPNPSIREVTASFTLLNADPATLEAFDIGGRRILYREVGSLGSGEHVVRLDEGLEFPPGVYTLRLTQAGRILTARGVVIR